jgi:hypothetical protein
LHQKASEDGAKRLVLATAVDNRPAQLLYQKNGWVRNTAFQHYNYELDDFAGLKASASLITLPNVVFGHEPIN